MKRRFTLTKLLDKTLTHSAYKCNKDPKRMKIIQRLNILLRSINHRECKWKLITKTYEFGINLLKIILFHNVWWKTVSIENRNLFIAITLYLKIIVDTIIKEIIHDIWL